MSAVEVREVFRAGNDRPSPIVPALMGRIMTRRTKNRAVFNRVRSAKLDVEYVMSMGTLTKLVLPAAFNIEADDSFST